MADDGRRLATIGQCEQGDGCMAELGTPHPTPAASPAVWCGDPPRPRTHGRHLRRSPPATFARAGSGARVEVDTVSRAARVEESAEAKYPVRGSHPSAAWADTPPRAPVEERFPVRDWWTDRDKIVLMLVLAGSG